MVDHAFKLNVGRQGFGSVNPEIRIIEGRISEVLLYMLFHTTFIIIIIKKKKFSNFWRNGQKTLKMRKCYLFLVNYVCMMTDC